VQNSDNNDKEIKVTEQNTPLESGVKIGDVYWIIGLMKIENMGKWTETNEPMDVPQISHCSLCGQMALPLNPAGA
jgi:hypothetical protein